MRFELKQDGKKVQVIGEDGEPMFTIAGYQNGILITGCDSLEDEPDSRTENLKIKPISPYEVLIENTPFSEEFDSMKVKCQGITDE